VKAILAELRQATEHAQRNALEALRVVDLSNVGPRALYFYLKPALVESHAEFRQGDADRRAGVADSRSRQRAPRPHRTGRPNKTEPRREPCARLPPGVGLYLPMIRAARRARWNALGRLWIRTLVVGGCESGRPEKQHPGQKETDDSTHWTILQRPDERVP
jgi:hypothetical protein